MNIAIEQLSHQYRVKQLYHEDIEAILRVGLSNPAYYQAMHSFVSKESIQQDLEALPPNKGFEDKAYVGFYQGQDLVAVMDLISHYPNAQTAHIGFFMMDKDYQGKKIGTSIIKEVLTCLKASQFQRVRLGYVEKNQQAMKFWTSLGFEATGDKREEEHYTIVIMEKAL